MYIMTVVKLFIGESPDLVKFRLVLKRLSRIIIFLNSGNLIRILDDTREFLLQCFNSSRVLIAGLDGSIFSPCKTFPELSQATCCVIIRYTCKPLSPNFSLSPEVSSSNATPVKLHVNNKCPAVLIEGFANKSCADKGALISCSKYPSNSFSQVRPIWFLNSRLFTSALCCVAQFRLFLDTARSNFFRQPSNSFVVSTAIHQERAVFLVNPFSRGSLVTCSPTLCC